MSDKKRLAPANFIAVREDIDGERVSGRFTNDVAAMQHAAESARVAPGTTVAVYERRATFTSRVVVDDDLPKATPA